MNQKLEQLRNKIDFIDKQLLKLLNNRAKLVIEVGQYKKASGEGFFSPDREKKILLNISRNNKGPLSKESIESIYREIINSSRSLEKKLKVMYYGNKNSSTYFAALKNFGKFTEYISANSISEVFDKVKNKSVDYGVVPIENFCKELVDFTLNMFIKSDLKIYSEINLIPERFFIIGKTIADPSGQDKTSLIISLKDKVGALEDILLIFRKYKINLTKIESKLTDSKCREYIFFIDFPGHIKNNKIEKLVNVLEQKSIFLKVLGSYPVDN